jgi:RHH-type transcriptional regulator, proline utilization regulon repressor / proline dehydrogenase / delta 1-pyrroline-5-carboxylate dehydrogenase
MRAADLDEAIRWQNQPAYGLTAGLHALDPAEIRYWKDRVDAGNLYVNRGITGAIVRRQPFGGWKRSVVGPGAKAGGPNYVASLGRWPAPGESEPYPARAGYDLAWQDMSVPADPTGLRCESNVFRYRPLHSVDLRVGEGARPDQVAAARAAAAAVGVSIVPAGSTADKVRFVGAVDDAALLTATDAGQWVDTTPVAADPRRELLRWVREQAVSETRHRHGNMTGRRGE